MAQALPDLFAFLSGGSWDRPLPVRRTLTNFIKVVSAVRLERTVDALSDPASRSTILTDKSQKGASRVR